MGRVAVETGLLVSSVLLARLLTPADFGRASVAAVAVAVATGLLTGGFGSPLIHEPNLTKARVQAAYAMSTIFGVVCMLLCVGAAFALEPVYDAETTRLIVIASPVFLIGSISAVPAALLQRALRFKIGTIIEICGALGGTTVAVILAAFGVGAEAIILGLVATSISSAALSFWAARPPVPHFDWEEAKGVIRFGLPASLSSLMGTAIRNADYALLALRFTPTQVGLYFRGYQLGVDYQSKISGIVLRILFPVLSRTTSQQELRKIRGRIVRLHATVIFPLLALLAIVAPALIPWFYGARWADAVVPTQILTVAGAAATIGTGIGPLMFAIGKPTALLINNIISFIAFSIVVIVFSAFGLVGVCIAISVYRVIAVLTSQYFLAQRLVGIPLRQTVFDDAWPAAACCAVMGAVALPVFTLLRHDSIPVFVTLAVTGMVGLIVYGFAMAKLFKGSWADVLLVARHILPKRMTRYLPDPPPSPVRVPEAVS